MFSLALLKFSNSSIDSKLVLSENCRIHGCFNAYLIVNRYLGLSFKSFFKRSIPK